MSTRLSSLTCNIQAILIIEFIQRLEFFHKAINRAWHDIFCAAVIIEYPCIPSIHIINMVFAISSLHDMIPVVVSELVWDIHYSLENPNFLINSLSGMTSIHLILVMSYIMAAHQPDRSTRDPPADIPQFSQRLISMHTRIGILSIHELFLIFAVQVVCRHIREFQDCGMQRSVVHLRRGVSVQLADGVCLHGVDRGLWMRCLSAVCLRVGVGVAGPLPW